MVSACYPCKRVAKTCDHVLFWRPMVYKLWAMVYGLLGINWIMVGAVRNELLARRGISRSKKCMDFISQTIFWTVWNKRNRRVFNDLSHVNDFEPIKSK